MIDLTKNEMINLIPVVVLIIITFIFGFWEISYWIGFTLAFIFLLQALRRELGEDSDPDTR